MQTQRDSQLIRGRWTRASRATSAWAALRESERAVADESAGHPPHRRRLDAIEGWIREAA